MILVFYFFLRGFNLCYENDINFSSNSQREILVWLVEVRFEIGPSGE